MLHFIDPNFCVTHKTDLEKVKNYIKAIENGDQFPPIEVLQKEDKYFVLDGAHRVAAHKFCKQEILAFIYEEDCCPKAYLIGMRIYLK